MSTLHERVALPDPESQPLLHPIDIEEARRSYRWATVLLALSSGETLTFIGALAWRATGDYLAATLAVLSTGVVAMLAGRHLLADAWGYVPRRRRDLEHRDPLRWRLTRAVLLPTALVVGVLLILSGLATDDTAAGVLPYSLGAAGGLAVALVVKAVARMVRRRSMSEVWVFGITTGLVLGGAVVAWVAGWVDPGAGGASSADLLVAGMGGILLLGFYAGWALLTRSRSGSPTSCS